MLALSHHLRTCKIYPLSVFRSCSNRKYTVIVVHIITLKITLNEERSRFFRLLLSVSHCSTLCVVWASACLSSECVHCFVLLRKCAAILFRSFFFLLVSFASFAFVVVYRCFGTIRRCQVRGASSEHWTISAIRFMIFRLGVLFNAFVALCYFNIMLVVIAYRQSYSCSTTHSTSHFCALVVLLLPRHILSALSLSVRVCTGLLPLYFMKQRENKNNKQQLANHFVCTLTI